MAQKNRAEVKTELNNDVTATVTIAKLNGVLINDLTESAVFRKDVITTGSGSGAQVISYLGIDQHEFTATANVTFSFTDLNIGDRVKLVVIKSAAYTVGFTGTVAQNLGHTVGLTTISYEIYYDNSGIIVTQMNQQTSGALGLGAFTGTGNTAMVAVQHADWVIQGKLLNFNTFLTFNQTVSSTTVTFTIDFGISVASLSSGQPALINKSDAEGTFVNGASAGQFDVTLTYDAAVSGISGLFLSFSTIIT